MFQLKLENKSNNIININDGINYVVVDVTGLNPPSASPFTSKSSNRKGVKYNGSTLDERNIIIAIKILGDVEYNRNALYSWIDTEEYTKVHYKNGLKNVYCEGYIQECDINYFTNNEIINLAILCPDPYWKDITDIVSEISSIIKQFTFSFAISDPIPFSTYKESNTTTIFNSGNETGIKIIIRCLEDVTNLRIFNANDTTKEFRLNTTLLKGWTVEIDTESSPKTVKAYTTDGTVQNLLKYTGGSVTWFRLKKGYNSLGYSAESGESDIEMTVSFTTKHLGV